MKATPPDPSSEWWTTTDIAALLGVQLGTVSSYHHRGQMPEPDSIVGRSPVWKPQRILDWQQSRPRPGVGGRVAQDQQTTSDGECLAVSTATATRDEAEQLAQLAVKARLAAGAQITGPVTSVFWHLGEFGSGEEWRLVLMTHSGRYTEVEALLRQNHPWDNPEIAATPIVTGSQDYLDWIKKAVTSAAD